MSGRQQAAPAPRSGGFVQLYDSREALPSSPLSSLVLNASSAAITTTTASLQAADDDENHASTSPPEAFETYNDSTSGGDGSASEQLHTPDVTHSSGGGDDAALDGQPEPQENNQDGDEDDENEDNDDAAEHNFPELFESWDELESYIREFAAQSYQVFRIRSTVSVRARNANVLKLKKAAAEGAAPPLLLADAWKFYSKTYTCTHGLSYQPSEKRLQKSAPLTVRASGCKARINASVSFNKAEKRHCVRAVVRGWHNHATDREKYYSYVENRRITDPLLLDTIARLECQGEKAKAIFDVLAKHVLETTGEALRWLGDA